MRRRGGSCSLTDSELREAIYLQASGLSKLWTAILDRLDGVAPATKKSRASRCLPKNVLLFTPSRKRATRELLS